MINLSTKLHELDFLQESHTLRYLSEICTTKRCFTYFQGFSYSNFIITPQNLTDLAKKLADNLFRRELTIAQRENI